MVIHFTEMMLQSYLYPQFLLLNCLLLSMKTDPENCPGVVVVTSVRDAILNAASHLNIKMCVAGRIVYLDHEIKRLDVSDDGAKLIVDFGDIDEDSSLQLGEGISVWGMLKRRERRLYFDASSITRL